MRLRVLGCSGGIGGRHLRTTSLLVDSDVGRGTSFTLWVPLVSPPADDHHGTANGVERPHAAADSDEGDLPTVRSIRGTGENTAPRQRTSS